MASTMQNRKIAVNEFAVIDLALFGAQDRIESLFGQTTATLDRLGLTTGGIRRGFRKTPRGGVGSHPSIHDIMLWLNNIENTEQFAEDILFLKRLHLTLKPRQRPA